MRRDIKTGDLTERQAKFAQALIRGATIPEAALGAGYSHGESGYQALDSSAVQAALSDYRDRVLKTEGANLGMTTMMDLCDGKVAAGVRYQAAKWLLEHAGHVAAQLGAGGDDPPLHQMTPDQLRKRADSIRQALGQMEADMPVIEGQATVSAQRSAPMVGAEGAEA